VIKHWNSGVSARRDATLVHLTLHSSYNIANPTRASDVLVGARLLFDMTEVPANIHSIERLGQTEALDKAPIVLLSAAVDTWVAAVRCLYIYIYIYLYQSSLSRKIKKNENENRELTFTGTYASTL
jgi:hypothetical protein